jgi:6,7-dimethyl-8-ribityllumazine synthase
MLRKEFKVRDAGDGARLHVGIIVSRFNEDITNALFAGALDTLEKWGVQEKNITAVRVPGAFEIPLATSRLLKTKKYHALIAIGCVIKGETKHDEYISSAVSHGLTDLMIEYRVPIGFGVITPNTLEQAKARATGKTNHGASAAQAALEMAVNS